MTSCRADQQAGARAVPLRHHRLVSNHDRLDRAAVFSCKVGGKDLTLQPRKRLPADAAPERLHQLGINNLRQAAEFLSDRLRLAYQRLQDAIFGTLRVDKVMAKDLRLGLEFAVNAAVPLLHSAGIPGHVKVE